MGDFTLVGAWFEWLDEYSDRGTHFVELARCSDSEIVRVEVTLDEEDVTEIMAVRGAGPASMWVLQHGEECARACIAAEYRGWRVDPFSQVWRPEADTKVGERAA